MSTSSPNIPAEVARHVLWHFGQPGGWQPGNFTQRLMETFAAADLTNAAKLGTAYPSYAAAMFVAQYDPNGIAALQLIAGVTAAALRCTRCSDEDGPFTDEQLCEACARPMPLDGVA